LGKERGANLDFSHSIHTHTETQMETRGHKERERDTQNESVKLSFVCSCKTFTQFLDAHTLTFWKEKAQIEEES